MINDIRCDRCVDAVYARPDCADCARERIVAANPVPDVVPDFRTDEDFANEVLELVCEWLSTQHPIDAAQLITALAERTSVRFAVRVTHTALQVYIEQLTWHVPTIQQPARLQIVPAVMGAIKRLAPGHLTAPDNLKNVRAGGPTQGSDR